MTAPGAPSVAARLLAHDVRLSARLQDLGDRARRLRTLAIPLARSADGWPWIVVLVLVAIAGPASVRTLALRTAVAVVATGVAVKIVKLLARRERPAGEWGGSYRRSDPHAFPSGHSARSFLLAVLAITYGPWWLGPLAVPWATSVAASRVVLGVHYLSDVLGGALLGVACGLLAVSL